MDTPNRPLFRSLCYGSHGAEAVNFASFGSTFDVGDLVVSAGWRPTSLRDFTVSAFDGTWHADWRFHISPIFRGKFWLFGVYDAVAIHAKKVTGRAIYPTWLPEGWEPSAPLPARQLPPVLGCRTVVDAWVDYIEGRGTRPLEQHATVARRAPKVQQPTVTIYPPPTDVRSCAGGQSADMYSGIGGYDTLLSTIATHLVLEIDRDVDAAAAWVVELSLLVSRAQTHPLYGGISVEDTDTFRLLANSSLPVPARLWAKVIIGLDKQPAIEALLEYVTNRSPPVFLAFYLEYVRMYSTDSRLSVLSRVSTDFGRRLARRVALAAADLGDGGQRALFDSQANTSQFADALNEVRTRRTDDDPFNFAEMFEQDLGLVFDAQSCGGGWGSKQVSDKDKHIEKQKKVIDAQERRIRLLEKKADQARQQSREIKDAKFTNGPMHKAVLGTAALVFAKKSVDFVRAAARFVRTLRSRALETTGVLRALDRYWSFARDAFGEFVGASFGYNVCRALALLILVVFLFNTFHSLSVHIVNVIAKFFTGGHIEEPLVKSAASGEHCWPLYALGGLAMFCMTGAARSHVKTFANWTALFATFHRAAEPLSDMAEQIMAIFTKMLDYFASKTPFGTPKWLLAFQEERFKPIADLQVASRTLMEYEIGVAQGKLPCNPAMNDRVRVLLDEVHRLHGLLPGNNRYRSRVEKLAKDTLAFSSRLNVAMTTAPSSAEATGIILSGVPGVGKSTLLEAMAHYFYSLARPDTYEQFRGNIQAQMFQRPANSSFYEGYQNQFMAVLDDLGQSRTVAGQETDQWAEVIKLINTFQSPLNFAAVESKGKVKFTSEFVVATTNQASFDMDVSINDVGAIARRFPHTYRVLVKDDWSVDGKLDFKKVSAHVAQHHRLPDAWRFYELKWAGKKLSDLKTGQPEEGYSFEQFVERVWTAHKNRRQNHELWTDALKRLDTRIASMASGESFFPLADVVAAAGDASFPIRLQGEDDAVSAMGPFAFIDDAKKADLQLRQFLIEHVARVDEALKYADCGDEYIRTNALEFLTQASIYGLVGDFKQLYQRASKKLKEAHKRTCPRKEHFSWFIKPPARLCIGVAALAASIALVTVFVKVVVAGVNGLFSGVWNLFTTRNDVRPAAGRAFAGPMAVERRAFPINDISQKIERNMFWILYQRGDSVECMGTVTFVAGRVVLMNRHFVVTLKHKNVDRVILRAVMPINGGCVEETYSIADFRTQSAVSFRIGGDLVLFKLTPVGAINKERADITTQFVDLEPGHNNSIYEDVCLRVMLDNNIETLVTRATPHPTIVCNMEYEDPVPIGNIVATNYRDAGSCGSHMRVNSGPMTGRILGVLVAHSKAFKHSFVQLVSRSEIVRGLEVLRQDCVPMATQATFCAGPSFPAVPGLEPLEVVNPPNPIPMRSNIVPSLFADFAGRSTKKPAHLWRFTTDDGVTVDPYVVALKPYMGCANHPDSSEVTRAAAEICEYLRSVAPFPANRGVQSFSEACLGAPYARIDSLNAKTSAGYPFAIGVQSKRSYLTGDGYALMQTCVNDRLEKAAVGKRVPTYFACFLKSELRSIDKADAGKSRVIAGSPMDYTVAFRMLFGDFMKYLYDNRIKTGYCVGVNVHGEDWEDLCEHLGGLESQVSAGDFTAFDAHQTPGYMRAFLQLADAFYGDDGNKLARHTLMCEAYDPTMVLGEYSFKWNRGLPSGHPATSYINCTTNLVLWHILWRRVTAGQYKLADHLKLAVYGDDHIVSKSAYATRVLAHDLVVGEMHKLGFVYTLEDKTSSVTSLRKLREVSFLKRRFALCIDGDLGAPLELASILEMVRWVKDPAQVPERTLENAQVALWELAYHGEDVWLKYGEPLRQRILRLYSVVLPDKQADWLVASRERPVNWYDK